MVTSTSATATRLDYRGTADVVTGGQTVAVLRFTADAMTLTGMEILGPCNGGQAWRSAVPSNAAASLHGALTLQAVELDATLDGQRVTYTASSPPTGSFAHVTVLTDVQILATNLTTALLELPAYQQSFTSC